MTSSVIELNKVMPNRVVTAAWGASADTNGMIFEPPKCMHSGMAASDAAANTPAHAVAWGVVGERDGVRSLGRTAFDLLDAEILVPQRQDDDRDVPVGCGRAPLVEQEVVIRPHAEVGQVLVLGEHEFVAAEAGEAGERG